MRRARIVAVVIGSLLFVLVCALNVAAQQFYGTITGTITDPSRAMVPNATVKVTNVDTKVTTTLKTNGAGVYVASSLIVGTYRVEAEAAGFKKAVADRITLEVGATPKVDLSLAWGKPLRSLRSQLRMLPSCRPSKPTWDKRWTRAGCRNCQHSATPAGGPTTS